jgi:hypothetical protein
MVHLQKSRSVTKAHLRRTKTQKENNVLDQKEFQEMMIEGANFFLSSPCKYFD